MARDYCGQSATVNPVHPLPSPPLQATPSNHYVHYASHLRAASWLAGGSWACMPGIATMGSCSGAINCVSVQSQLTIRSMLFLSFLRAASVTSGWHYHCSLIMDMPRVP